MAKALVVDDNDTLRQGVVEVLERMGHQVFEAPGGAEGLEQFDEQSPDLVITDLKMDGVDGMEVLQTVREASPETVVMMMTAFGSIERAVEAMKAGAFDFIAKPFPPDLLRTRVERALQIRDERRRTERLEHENEMLRRDSDLEFDAEIIGESPPMKQVLDRVEQAAHSDSTVFIHGESGTGKELVARALHRASPRAEGPFVKVNCSALAESLLESELFGHEKGAFTSAHKRRLGRFELADGGTIFLDEIGDISPAIQLKLLRVLQEHEFERVGGEETLSTDVRVVTATNRDLRQAVEDGDFREDLFYRLHIIPIELPPLRRRRDDIELLVQHFIDKLGSRTRSSATEVDPEVLEVLKSHSWPGNVRELENVIEHALVFAGGDTITIDELPPMLGGGEGQPEVGLSAVEQSSLPEVLEEIEQELIEEAFERAGGVKAETARLLGIKPSALYYKLEKYDIEQGEESEETTS